MRITATQLRILRTIQAHPTASYDEVGQHCDLTRADVMQYLKHFARRNGIASYIWLVQHIADYDLSTLKPYRERAGAMGIHWHEGDRRWYVRIGRRWCSPAYHFRSDAVEARAAMLRALG